MAQLGPSMILAEPPDLIGTTRSLARENRGFITRSLELVKGINPNIIVFHSAGIRTAADVVDIIRAGAEATGTTSGIVRADNPIRQMDEMLIALRQTWQEMHP